MDSHQFEDNLIQNKDIFKHLESFDNLKEEDQYIISVAANVIESNEKFISNNNQSQEVAKNSEKYLLVTIERLTFKFNQFEYFFDVESSEIFGQRFNSIFFYQILEKMIKNNLSGEAQKQSFQLPPRIVIEISIDIYVQYTKLLPLNKHDKDRFFIHHMKDLIFIEQQQFLYQSAKLAEQYQQQFESKEQFKIDGQCQNLIRVLVIGKKLTNIDCQHYFDNPFRIENGELLQWDSIFYDSSKAIYPFQEFNKLYSNQNMLNCISQLKKYKFSNNYEEIRSILIEYFGQLNDLQVFQQLLEVLEQCRQVIQLETLMRRFVDQQSKESITSAKITRKQNENISSLEKLLDQTYSQLDPRFRTKFYNFADEEQISQYIDAPIYDEFDLRSEGDCAYEIQEDGIILYFKMKFCQSKIGYCSLLNYSKDKMLREKGNLAQLVLAEGEEGMELQKLNFILEKNSRSIVLEYLSKQYSSKLMIDILLRIVQVRIKRIMLNPQLRNQHIIEVKKQQKPIMLEI